MSQQNRTPRMEDRSFFSEGPSEPQIHIEHQAALAATLFRSPSDPEELVLELDSGELRLRVSREG